MPDHYEIDDPRPIAAEAPYTYFIPSEEELAAIGPGDLVKLIFRAVPPSEDWGAERMWVIVDEADGDELRGRLDNEPRDIKGLKPGDMVRCRRHEVISVDWSEERSEAPPEPPRRREYWDRCMVDTGVLNDGLWVWYLYRETPDLYEPDDEYPDSGWRIRGDRRGVSDEELEERGASYVALGAVLNRDDSWLHLIDEPVGSAFIREREDGPFVRSD